MIDRFESRARDSVVYATMLTLIPKLVVVFVVVQFLAADHTERTDCTCERFEETPHVLSVKTTVTPTDVAKQLMGLEEDIASVVETYSRSPPSTYVRGMRNVRYESYTQTITGQSKFPVHNGTGGVQYTYVDFETTIEDVLVAKCYNVTTNKSCIMHVPPDLHTYLHMQEDSPIDDFIQQLMVWFCGGAALAAVGRFFGMV